MNQTPGSMEESIRKAIVVRIQEIGDEEAKAAAARVEKRVRESLVNLSVELLKRFEISRPFDSTIQIRINTDPNQR